ncbi:DUF421 domain-containing protein [Mesobacillus harenae]|uniref:DUF421 domain-containing protein n=1 Tax=Mesobacillus harenae TaxID=2213203 RepID=UPI001580C95E|nr:YetF domain-containing protein [Mesobacillus harenae]
MFFDSWDTIGRTLVVGFLAYIALVLLLRVSGKRTLTKLNAFDLVVTVALGSTLATILLNRNVRLAEGIMAFALLIGLQYIMTWLSVRSETFSKLIKSEPELLYYKGQYFKSVMKKERILKTEILQAARSNGAGSMDNVEAVVLETDGSIGILKTTAKSEKSTLLNVNNNSQHSIE